MSEEAPHKTHKAAKDPPDFPYTLYQVSWAFGIDSLIKDHGYTTSKTDFTACKQMFAMAGDRIPFDSAEELEATKVDITTAAREQYIDHRTHADCPAKEEAALYWYPRKGGVIDRIGDETKNTVMMFGWL
jgi:hypothetical protein